MGARTLTGLMAAVLATVSGAQTATLMATNVSVKPGNPHAKQESAGSQPSVQTQPSMQAQSVPGPGAPYTVHAGDTLTVTFRYTPEFNDEVVVLPDGHAVLKATGDIPVAGLTLPQLTKAIEDGSTAKLVNPDVVVQLKDFERPHFVVAGEVQTPGKFELRRATTALQAILLAGGPKEDAAMNHVYLFRRLNADTAEVHVLKLGRYDGAVRDKNDLQLQPDDMILVRHDAIEKIGRVVKALNLGVYLNPLPSNGIQSLF